MITNAATKTITATQIELPMVANYLEHCVPKAERKDWKVNIIKNEIEFRKRNLLLI